MSTIAATFDQFGTNLNCVFSEVEVEKAHSIVCNWGGLFWRTCIKSIYVHGLVIGPHFVVGSIRRATTEKGTIEISVVFLKGQLVEALLYSTSSSRNNESTVATHRVIARVC